ncbi:MAG: HNH endonuclease [Bacteroidota bacterium]
MHLLQKYLHSFKKLNPNKSKLLGTAPHKPILLISLLQAFTSKVYNSPQIYITPELVSLFKTNWGLLAYTNHNCNFALPFYHLKSSNFWKLIPKHGFEGILQSSSSIGSFSHLNATVEYAEISEELFQLICDKKNNEILKQFLLDEYFPDTQKQFSDSENESAQLLKGFEIKILKETSQEYRAEIQELLEQKNEEEIFLRGAAFKREIPKIYNNTCCISGMRIDATISISMIDACHIIPFSKSYDDTIRNGIALCPNLHRAFDRGLISINKDYSIIVSEVFKEIETAYSIKVFKGKRIMLPKVEIYWPLKENLEWHRENVFKS